MKIGRAVLHLLAMQLLGVVPATYAQTQSSDWSLVEQLRPGTPISVKGRLRVQCNFRHADEKQLVCDPRTQGGFLRPPIQLPRELVREVRIERVEASTVAGAAIGAGAGAALGASSGNGTLTRGGSALLGGGIGGLIGGTFSRQFPFLHGKVVYERP
jgi:uncharacterized protein YcfJ